MNPFDLLGDDDNEDPAQLIAAAYQKIEPKKEPGKPTSKPAAQAKLPGKPLPPAQAVREAKSESARGGRGGGRGYGRGRGAGGRSYRDSSSNETSFGNREITPIQGTSNEINGERPYERRGGYGGPRGPFRGGRRGGFSNGDAREGEFDRPRRTFDRHSGTGRGYEMKRDGSGRGNWGNEADEVAPVTSEVIEGGEKPPSEKPTAEEDSAAEGDKEASKDEVEEKEPENKEMTLEEYEKLLEEKRKALISLKTEERKVDTKAFESMKPLANKKANDDVFIKLGSDNKDKKKELAEKEERSKKSVSINEFLKPAEGEQYYSNRGGRGGRGRGSRGGSRGGGYYRGGDNASAPAIEDPGQFPTLGGGK